MVTADNDRAPLLVLLAGLLGLCHDCWAGAAAASWMNLPVVFGILLWITVVARFFGRMYRAGGLPIDIPAYTRRLSRQVYLLLYVLLLFSLIIGIFHAAPHRAAVATATDFQGYLAGGIVTLITIRVLSALGQRFVVDGAAKPALQGLQGNGRLK